MGGGGVVAATVETKDVVVARGNVPPRVVEAVFRVLITVLVGVVVVVVVVGTVVVVGMSIATTATSAANDVKPPEVNDEVVTEISFDAKLSVVRTELKLVSRIDKTKLLQRENISTLRARVWGNISNKHSYRTCRDDSIRRGLHGNDRHVRYTKANVLN